MTTDAITLTGIEALGCHGVEPHEKTTPQRFLVDVAIGVDLARAGATDDLADTVNYADVALSIRRRIEQDSYELIERLATVIADDILGRRRVLSVAVTVHKPDAPIDATAADVAVTIVRAQPSAN